MSITQSDFLSAALIMTISGAAIGIIIGIIILLDTKSKNKKKVRRK